MAADTNELLRHTREESHYPESHAALHPSPSRSYCPDCARYIPPSELTDHHAAHPGHTPLPKGQAPEGPALSVEGLFGRPMTPPTFGMDERFLARLRGVAAMAAHMWKTHAWEAVTAVQKFLGVFKRVEADSGPRGGGSHVEAVNRLLGHSKWRQALDVMVAGPGVDTTPADLATLRGLFPEPRESVAWRRNDVTRQPPLAKLTVPQVRGIIENLMGSTSPGPSGLSNVMVKKLVTSEDWLALVTTCFNDLLARPELIEQVPALYAFNVIGIPKPRGGFRPICIQESLLSVFHKAVLANMRAQRMYSLVEEQLAFRSNAAVRGALKLRDFRNQGLELVSLDVSNAFNSLPFAEIEAALANQGLDERLVRYVMSSIHARNSSAVGRMRCGTPQGDPLSMDLFAIAVDPILKEMATRFPLVAFADDVVLGVQPGTDVGEVVGWATALYARIGLSISGDKCRTTIGGGTVPFLGLEYTSGQPVLLGEKLLEVAQKGTEAIRASGIPKHDAYQILTRTLVQQVNYGPFIDDPAAKSLYCQIDNLLVGLACDLTGLSPEGARDLITRPRCHGGASAILPGVQFDAYQRYTETVAAGRTPVFRALRESIQTATGLAPIAEGAYDLSIAGFAINSDTRLRDEEFFDLCMAHRRYFEEGNAPLPPAPADLVCPMCQKPLTFRHASTCIKLSWIWERRHFATCLLLKSSLPKVFPGEIAGAGRGGPNPDLISSEGVAVDIRIPAREYIQDAYTEKIRKYRGPFHERVMPIVFSTDYTVHRETLAHLTNLTGNDPTKLGHILRRAAGLVVYWNTQAENKAAELVESSAGIQLQEVLNNQ